jgi:hypothetical protein
MFWFGLWNCSIFALDLNQVEPKQPNEDQQGKKRQIITKQSETKWNKSRKNKVAEQWVGLYYYSLHPKLLVSVQPKLQN